jgi:glycosyltransferase involved in cell wall biosynthesis
MRLTLLAPPLRDPLSGATVYVQRLAAELRGLGHATRVAEVFDPLSPADAACAAWDAVPPDTRPVIDGRILPSFGGLDDALAARGAVGLIHHPASRETGLSDSEQAALHRLEQRLFAHLAQVIVTSEATAGQLASTYALDPARIRVVAPGTDAAPRSGGSGQGTCQVLSVGALIPRKGHDLLLRALGRLFDLDWHLTIAGDPDQDPVHANGLAALAESLDITRQVTFAGAIRGAALDSLWQHADLFALASHHEGYGTALAEALKRGLPVAVTAVGAAPGLVSPEAGTVSEPGDRDQLSKSLRRLIFSRELREDMAEAAWQIGQTLPTWPEQAALFAAALGGPTG